MIVERVPWLLTLAYGAAVLVAAWAIGTLLARRRTAALVVAAFLAGTLAGHHLAATSRSADLPAPGPRAVPGYEHGRREPSVAAPRTGTPLPVASHAPAPTGTGPAASGNTPDPNPSSVNGLASWYCLPGRSPCTRGYPPGPFAAAGPALRDALGPDWRGRTVEVCAEACVTVTLVDWMAHPGRVIDLYAEVFLDLAPLRVGIVEVTISW